MRLEERRLLVALPVAGVIAGILVLPAMYFLGLWLAPPRPVAETKPVPALLREALWARANGGIATELRPVNPVAIVRHVACTERADHAGDPQARATRLADCRNHLPAMRGVEYLAGVHLRDHRVEPSFRTGISRVATAIWITRSWTREAFLDTLAERGEFGPRWRGAEAAARGYFGGTAAELTLPQAATLAAFVGDRGTDPWCEPEVATGLRNRILDRMRDNGVISEAAWHAARSEPFELAAAPPTHRCPR